MADIYGKLTEHPEFPIEDARRFTVEIKLHDFEPESESQLQGGRMRRVPGSFCRRCGFNRVAAVHPKES